MFEKSSSFALVPSKIREQSQDGNFSKNKMDGNEINVLKCTL